MRLPSMPPDGVGGRTPLELRGAVKWGIYKGYNGPEYGFRPEKQETVA